MKERQGDLFDDLAKAAGVPREYFTGEMIDQETGEVMRRVLNYYMTPTEKVNATYRVLQKNGMSSSNAMKRSLQSHRADGNITAEQAQKLWDRWRQDLGLFLQRLE